MPLDPEVALLLDSEKGQPPRSALDVAATRERMRRAAALAGPPPAVARVEDLTLPSQIRARQYWPKDDAALPIAVYFHGGRFFSGDLESHDAACRILALEAGCRLLAVDYRLAPEHRFPAALDDAAAAVEFALGQGVPVAVAGDSAGANLAAGAALLERARLRAQLLVYPMIDATCLAASYRDYAEGYGPGAGDMQRGWSEYLGDAADPRDPRVSPVFAEDLTGLAPAFVLTAEYDTLRDEGERYARRLIESGNLVQARRYLGTIHGFFTMPGVLRAAREAIAEAGAFLRHRLMPA